MSNVSRAQARVVRAAYKSLLRSASKLDASPSMLPVSAHLSSFVPAQPAQPVFATWKSAVRAEFRKNASVPVGPALQPLLDGALRVMALANKRVASLLAASSSSVSVATPEPSRPSSVLYSVGQVFVHRQSGYRAVIIGWDERCKAGDKWVAATRSARLPHGLNQPFYHVLVDVRDRPDARICYVAQDNIDLLPLAAASTAAATAGPVAAAPADAASSSAASAGASSSSSSLARFIVIHPLLTRYFRTLKANTASAASATASAPKTLPLAAYYEPVAQLSKAFPADTPASIDLALLLRQRATVAAAESAARSSSSSSVLATGSLRNVWLSAAPSSKAGIVASAGGALKAATVASASGAESGSDSDDEGAEGEPLKRGSGSGRRAASGRLA